MALSISRRDAEDVTVLALKGLFEFEMSSILRDAISTVIAEGRRKIVLNFADVTDLKSGGLGAVVHSYTSVRRVGGAMRLCSLPRQSKGLLEITKLLRVIDASDDEATAIARLSSPPFYGRCPLNGCSGNIEFVHELPDSSSGKCRKCDSVCGIDGPDNIYASQVRKIRRLSAPTYAKGKIWVQRGQTWEACLSGPLEVFSVDTLENVWRSIPPPRPCSFEISSDDISEQGVTALLRLCADDTDGKKVVVVAGNNRHRFPPDAPVYTDKADAVAYLGGTIKFSEWNITIDRVAPNPPKSA